jgi:hypothetical protein
MKINLKNKSPSFDKAVRMKANRNRCSTCGKEFRILFIHSHGYDGNKSLNKEKMFPDHKQFKQDQPAISYFTPKPFSRKRTRFFGLRMSWTVFCPVLLLLECDCGEYRYIGTKYGQNTLVDIPYADYALLKMPMNTNEITHLKRRKSK